MRISRVQRLVVLALSLMLLIVLGVVVTYFPAALGPAGLKIQGSLDHPFFTLGGLPVTIFFLIKAAIFLVALFLGSHFILIILQKRVLKHTPLALGQQYAVAKVISYLLFVLGLIIGLQSLGLNLNSLVVVGGALGIGVGLGLQAIVSNFVAGLILLLEQPVRLGDRIAVGETYGDVIRLRGRSTWIRTNDNVVIIVPNSDFINQKVTNWTANDRRVRISMPFGTSYGSEPNRVRDVVLAVAGKHPDVLPDPAPEVIFAEFGDSSLNFELRVWTIQQVQTPTRLKSDLYFAIFEAFKNESIEIPFPQRDLHVRSVSREISEALGSATVSPRPDGVPQTSAERKSSK